MITSNRIPAAPDFSFNGMAAWFAALDARGLLFHPDEPPETIVSLESGKPLFNAEEVASLAGIIDSLFAMHSDQVYDAAYPLFIARMGTEQGA